MAAVSSSEVLSALALAGIMGVLGQGTRAAVGLKNAGRLGGTPDQQSAFSAAYFFLSLMIGFIAGVLAGLAVGLDQLLSFQTGDIKVLLGIAAAGYAGADFVENSMSIIIPSSSKAEGASVAPVPQAIVSNDVSALTAHTAALTGAIQQLTSTSQPPAIATANVPEFWPALQRVFSGIDRTRWESALTQGFQRFALTNNRRIAAAVGQFAVEAGESFREVVENMSYNASRMTEVWPSTFKTDADAAPYAHNPEKLGNFIYANKLGNGNEASGDGYRFRGRGLIQLTGRDEYSEFGAAIGMTAEEVSSYCETPEGAAVSGCWYLSSRGCLPLADVWNVDAITRRVNGRKMLDHVKRLKYANALLAELSKG